MNKVIDWRENGGAKSFWGEISPCEHLVQIYEDDGAFLDCLEGFVHGGLKAGDAVIIIATAVHRQSLEYRLRANGVNLAFAQMEGQYFPFDAVESLSNFMKAGWPDEILFKRFLDSVLERARRKNDRRVALFGEMVALLCRQVVITAQRVWLEHLWHPVLPVCGLLAILCLSKEWFHTERRCVNSRNLRSALKSHFGLAGTIPPRH